MGYEVQAEDGREMRVIGAQQTDECFTGDSTGTINISAMWRDIQAGKARAIFKSAHLNDTALDAIINKDIDKDRLAKMTPERAEIPMIAIARANGTHSLVDGNHRLAKRHERGEKFFKFWEFTEDALQRYRVTIYWKEGHGQEFIAQTAMDILDKTIGTFPIFDDAGEVVGFRKEPKG